MTNATELQVLRSIDKYDKVGDDGLFDLLTDGRKDESGAFIEGCKISHGQAMTLLTMVNAGKSTGVAKRLKLMAALEDITDPSSGKTLWDVLLDGKPGNIGWALDDIVDRLSIQAKATLGR